MSLETKGQRHGCVIAFEGKQAKSALLLFAQTSSFRSRNVLGGVKPFENSRL